MFYVSCGVNFYFLVLLILLENFLNDAKNLENLLHSQTTVLYTLPTFCTSLKIYHNNFFLKLLNSKYYQIYVKLRVFVKSTVIFKIADF